MLSENSFEKFIIYPNESIDKLTVNRSFERLYDEILSKSDKNSPITIANATESDYGLVKYSSINEYIRTPPEILDDKNYFDDYNNAAMNLEAMTDFSKKISEDSSMTSMYTSGGGNIQDHRGWLKIDIGNVNTLDMPNGNRMFIGSFDISLSNLQEMFNTTAVSSESKTHSIELSGFPTVIDMTTDDIISLTDYTLDSDNDEQSRIDVEKLNGLNGTEIFCPYIAPVTATMRHNICNSTKYSSYKQSYIEIIMSMEIDLLKFYTQFYGYRKYTMLNDGNVASTEYTSAIDRPIEELIFTTTPLVMSQLSFYNNDSKPLPTFGYSNPDKLADENQFISTNTISDKQLTSVDVDGYELSVVNGYVSMKKFENIHRKNGEIYNNRIHFDVSMKFMVGGAYDPLMLDGLRGINAKSKLQFMMIGV